MSPGKRAKHSAEIKPEIESATNGPPSPSANIPSAKTSQPVKDENPITKVESMDPALLDEEEMEVGEGEPPKHRFAGGYDELKSFKGQYYAGMAIGGSHTWNYDPGVWKETKLEPDLWKIDFQTTKRRDRKAPQGSGAPVGTEYHWLIVAHQYVRKEDANTYSTHMMGSKYKLAHKSVASEKWSIGTVMGQRQREIELLEDATHRVEGLPPVLKEQKVPETTHQKGQRTLDSLFKVKAEKEGTTASLKRKSEGGEGEATPE
ncbi:hypothetical protein V1525DRAFT_390155 [Lipomyces kononenkoae]|uniref:Uncharacterized protein n=1 Tax=Lipomyces kononenkoae TaxID=34357 RepID=A0ACC3SVQ5_LIPKO